MHRYSTLSKYAMCPKAYRFSEQNEPGLDSAIMHDGSAAHEVYEAYGRHCCATNQESDPSELPVIATGLNVFPGSDLYDSLIQPFGRRHKFPADSAIGFEETISINQDGEHVNDDSEDVFMRGTIDYIASVPEDPDALRIVDYKTGWNTDANPLQMRIYAMLAVAAYPATKRVICTFDYTRHGITKTREYDVDDCRTTLSMCKVIAGKIAADTQFSATPGEHCLTCQWRMWCDYKPQMVNAINCIQDAQFAVEAISVLVKDLEDQKLMLRAWCSEHGNVIHNGTIWGHHARETEGFYDPKRFFDTCTEINIDPYPHLVVNNTTVKRLRRKGKYPLELEEILEHKRTVAFRAMKAGHQDED